MAPAIFGTNKRTRLLAYKKAQYVLHRPKQYVPKFQEGLVVPLFKKPKLSCAKFIIEGTHETVATKLQNSKCGHVTKMQNALGRKLKRERALLSVTGLANQNAGILFSGGTRYS